jgi:hypothetical protein
MTQVTFDLRAVDATGRVPVDGRIRWQPVDRRVDGSVVILPEVHGVKLVAGQASAELDPGYYWFTESTAAGGSAIRLVPAAGPVAYADLVAVDPVTLDPSAAPDPAWLAMARATVTSGSIVGDDLVLQRTDGTTVDAGDVRGPVGPVPDVAVGLVETGPETPGIIGPMGPQGPKGDPGGFTTGTSLGTADLNTITADGIYRQATTANATLAANYPLANTIGVLYVNQASGALYVQQTFYPMASTPARSFYTRVMSNGVWQPWRAYGSQRVDQAAGRAMYTWDDVNQREQLFYGDTGVRRIETLFINGWTAAIASLRRTNSIVQLGLYNVSPSAQTAPTAYTLPSGFRPAGFGGNICFPTREGSNWSVLVVNGAGDVQPSTVALNSIGAIHLLTWSTADAWPTTLPGSASGSIPNL